MSVYQCVCMYVMQYVCRSCNMSVCHAICLYVMQYIWMSCNRSVCHPIGQSFCMSTCLYVVMPIFVCRMVVCVYVCMCVSVYVCMSVWVFVCLYVLSRIYYLWCLVLYSDIYKDGAARDTATINPFIQIINMYIGLTLYWILD